jgi:AraC-like DNA-binding protein
MSRRTFTRLFRHETGMSFSEWRQQACIIIALPRLAAGDPEARCGDLAKSISTIMALRKIWAYPRSS